MVIHMSKYKLEGDDEGWKAHSLEKIYTICASVTIKTNIILFLTSMHMQVNYLFQWR